MSCNTSDQNREYRRSLNEYNEKTNKTDDQTNVQYENTCVFGTGLQYDGKGLKNSFHGVSYQMKLPMHFIVRGLTQNYNFQVATEVEEADKFDDLIFSCEDEVAFFQAKHKLDNNLKITENQLLSGVGDFSVPKYFKSYEHILNEEKLQKLIEDKGITLMLSTNIGINSSIKENFELITASSILSGSKILALSTEMERSNYYIIKTKSQLYKTLAELLSKAKLEEPSTRVAEHLAAVLLKKNKNKLSKFVQGSEKHLEWFLDNIFEVDKNDNKTLNIVEVTFKDSFLSENNESNFQKTFSKTYFSNKGTGKKNTMNLHEHLSDFKFQIPNSSALTSKMEAVGNRRDNVKKFLDILVFAVSQPNESELGPMIEKEIGDYMGHDNRQSIASKFNLYIQDWAKQKVTGKKCRYLTNEDAEREFAVWGQENLSQNRMDDIKKNLCTFEKSNEVVVNLSNFLKTKNDADVLCLYNTQTLFSKIKACQVLESFANENIKQKFIFCDIKDLIVMENTKKCLVKAFSSQTCNTMFISLQDYKLNNYDVKILRKLLQVVIETNINTKQPQSNKQRKRLIITIPEEKKPEFIKEFCFENNGFKSWSLNDFNNSFSDLDQKSRRHLIEKGCIKLHGNSITGLLSEKELALYIRDEMLLKFISNELEISDKVSPVNKKINHYYIKRSLVSVIVNQNITKDTGFHFVREDTQHTDIKNQEVVVFSENDKLFEHFRKTNVDVHWLRETNNTYIWMASQGSVTKLRKYVSAQNSDPDCEPELSIPITNINDLKNDVVLISASPGMGKSILLSHIAEKWKEKETSFFVSKINFADYCEELDRPSENKLTLEQAIRFVFITTQIESPRIVQSESTFNLLTIKKDGSLAFSPKPNFNDMDHLRAMVFCNLYNEEKIILLLDGFDEIASDYCKTTLNLLQMLKRSKVRKMWVTTRPYDFAKDLENCLKTFTYTMKPLSEDEQLTFLENFWGPKIKYRRSEILSSVKNFLISLDLSTLSAIHKAEKRQNLNTISPSFMGVPLHSYMLAKVLTNDFIKFYSQSNDNAPTFTPLTIFYLYSNFFQIKFEKSLCKEGTLNRNPRFLDMKENAENDHGKLALLEIFDENLLTQLVSEEDKIKLLNLVKIGKERTGIVAEVVNNKPRFVHRTFAEYFAAHYLATILLRPDESETKKAAKLLLYNSVTGNPEYYYVLFTFFNYKVVSESENKEIFEAAIGANIQKVSEKYQTCDRLKRTPMHLIIMYLKDVYVDFVSDYGEVLSLELPMFKTIQAITYSNSDVLFQWTPAHYFTVCPFRHVYLYDSHLTKFLDDFTQDILGRTPLILLILTHYSYTYLKKVSIFNLTCLNMQDHFLKTALHYAMENFKKCISSYDRKSRKNGHLRKDLNTICCLLKHGARIDIPDNQGVTPVEMINSIVTKETEGILEELSDYQKRKIDEYDCDDIYLVSLNYITEHIEKYSHNVFSFKIDEVNTLACTGRTARYYNVEENDSKTGRNLINKSLPCQQYLDAQQKQRVNSNIKPLLIYTLLRQQLQDNDVPISPVSVSSISKSK